MKSLLTIKFILFFSLAFCQRPGTISGSIVDEDGKPVSRAILHYGDMNSDSVYSDFQGNFSLFYPSYQDSIYYIGVTREGFLPKTFQVDFYSPRVVLSRPFVLRSRKGNWYDSNQIDSTHLGITVSEAIKKYKLDIEDCMLWDKPPGKYYGFSAELADSSYVFFTIKGRFSKERLAMTDVLQLEISGFGIADNKGNDRIIGNGFIYYNPYFIEERMKTHTQ